MTTNASPRHYFFYGNRTEPVLAACAEARSEATAGKLPPPAVANARAPTCPARHE